jgi:hypothetical protein
MKISGSGGIAPPFLTSALDGELHAPADIPGEIFHGIHWIGSWMGHRAGIDDVEKRKNLLLLPGIEPKSSCLQPY